MVEITKGDWKLFRERITDWQEDWMEHLNQEYIKLLSGKGNASDKFWELEERIRKDKKKSGVQLELRKSETVWNLAALLKDGVINTEDLEGFSEGLKEAVKQREDL